MTNPHYEAIKRALKKKPKTWLVTGCAGFIGSHLIETLLKLNQNVVGLDNFATGHRKNLALVRKSVGEKAWKRFHFIRGDIRKLADCYRAFGLRPQHPALRTQHPLPRTQHQKFKTLNSRFKIDIALHQAALGSVPRSIKDPLSTHEVNVTGFVNMLVAARDAGAKRFVYASSSSVYGDSRELPKREDRIGNQLSPYAVSKYANELYAKVFGRCYGLETIGLRYFNVFGPRQDPNGPYAAVIPRWIAAIQKGMPAQIYGDGKTSRDFCYVDNVVQANLLAGLTKNKGALNQAYNIACGTRTSLNQLYSLISKVFRVTKQPVTRSQSASKNKLDIKNSGSFVGRHLTKSIQPPKRAYLKFRIGDIRDSLADISNAKLGMGYNNAIKIKTGISRLFDTEIKNKTTIRQKLEVKA